MIFVADAGTTFFKAALADNSGVIRSPVRRILLKDRNPHRPPQHWLSALSSAYSDLASDGSRVDCILLTGNAPTAVAVLPDGSAPVAVLWNNSPDPGSPGFMDRFIRLKTLYPDLYSKCRHILGCPEYLTCCLTSNAVAGAPAEGFEHFYWTEEKLKANGINPHLIPPFAESGSPAGTTTGRYGFPKGIPVLVPYPDYVPAIIGSGAVHPGILCIRTGTGDGLNLCIEKRTEIPSFMTARHPNGRDWNISCIIPDTGSSIRCKLMKHPSPGNKTSRSLPENPEVTEIFRNICKTENEKIKALKPLGIREARLAGGSMSTPFFNRIRADALNELNIPLYTTGCEETGLQGLAVLAYSSLDKSDISLNADRIVKVRPASDQTSSSRI